MSEGHGSGFLDDLDHSLVVSGYDQDCSCRRLLGLREVLPRVELRAVGVHVQRVRFDDRRFHLLWLLSKEFNH